MKILNEYGYRLGIVTASIPEVAKGVISKLGYKFFECVVARTKDKKFKQKPDPYSLQIGLNIMGLNGRDAVYVGDNLTDATAAKRAEMKSILIQRDGKRFDRNNGSVIIDSLYKLLLKKL